jgi:hypothetical protein
MTGLNFQLDTLIKVRQGFARPLVDDVEREVTRQLQAVKLNEKIRPGQTVAITAGSRGIANIANITRAIVRFVQSLQAEAFIVPAMGSHGTATADGQLRVLAKYGITSEYCGCPIRSSMETETIAHSPLGFPVLCDQQALQADHVIVCNRVKAHTSIAGDLESGIVKMLLIGLGNHAGAVIYHRAMADHSFQEIAADLAEMVIDKANVAAGVAIVENAFDETAMIRAMPAGEMIEQEKKLLFESKRLMARLPFRHLDVLLIDQFGKNISGTGLDTNVVGRKFNDHLPGADEWPKIKNICLRSLTEQSSGNATGIGIAEFCHRRILDQMDRAATRINCLTAMHPTGGMIPLDFESDRAMLQAAFSTVGLTPPADVKFVWIRDTLHLQTILCSQSLKSEIARHDSLEIIDEVNFEFAADGDINMNMFE